MGLREKLNDNPIIGRSIAGVLLAAAIVFVVMRSVGNEPPDSIDRRSEMVTIRDTETGDEWEMNRGRFEQMLMTSDGMIDPSGGIPSKFSEGRKTGILVDKDDWEETVRRINALKERYADD